jgi:hypothetical protein
MGQPSFIDSKKHQILKPIFRRPRIFTGKSARFTHAAFTSGTHLILFHHKTTKWTFKLKFFLALIPFAAEVWAWWRWR